MYRLANSAGTFWKIMPSKLIKYKLKKGICWFFTMVVVIKPKIILLQRALACLHSFMDLQRDKP